MRRATTTVTVPGIATVQARPFRSLLDARRFAERIERNPGDYLATLKAYRVPGIVDIRRPID